MHLELPSESFLVTFHTDEKAKSLGEAVDIGPLPVVNYSYFMIDDPDGIRWPDFGDLTKGYDDATSGAPSSSTHPGSRHGGSFGLFEDENQEIEESPKEQVIEQEFATAINQLPIHHPMSINAILNLKEEQQIAHEKILDEDLIAIALSKDHHEEEVEEDIDDDPLLSNKDKLGTIHSCVSRLDLSNPTHVVAHKVLRGIQFKIRTNGKKHATLD
ncbi:hypothetical protein LWI28_022853 [Acer negundo]|uniref:Uncharacterized protein n=1 Tax=Acer negundo TaxID=4023 RepID=A0AAD5NNV6_ACENE|nr:hypothetical protein LWI28_022853 [Acer negundo]